MQQADTAEPDSTAVRVALWRALHVNIDSPPHVLEDTVGLSIDAPADDWRSRPDMDPQGTKTFRASIVARARYIEDLVAEEADQGVGQYVILGAGLDSFAQRRPAIASRLEVFEIDRPDPQKWKIQRLIELGFGVPDWLHFVPVDFESSDDWLQKLDAAGFDRNRPAVVASTGVTMYLSRDAIFQMLTEVARLRPGSTLAMSYILPPELATPEERKAFEGAVKGARASGTPFTSFFTPDEIMTLARNAGFKEVTNVSAADLSDLYFSNRVDGLRPGSEEILVAKT